MSEKGKVQVSVVVLPKAEILDPQGKAVLGSLKSLGFDEVADCRIGKVVRLTLNGDGSDNALIRRKVSDMASSLLSNPITEDFEIVFDKGDESK
ncbi:MAG: phosphoribosylformylglycinamidine synthase subunit PurS [Deltaproteobacteria bacterium]|nr:phosphoribosylformylglycinamidine synthase subunit PurS [Deltaproteobacteria bacterium]